MTSNALSIIQALWPQLCSFPMLIASKVSHWEQKLTEETCNLDPVAKQKQLESALEQLPEAKELPAKFIQLLPNHCGEPGSVGCIPNDKSHPLVALAEDIIKSHYLAIKVKQTQTLDQVFMDLITKTAIRNEQERILQQMLALNKDPLVNHKLGQLSKQVQQLAKEVARGRSQRERGKDKAGYTKRVQAILLSTLVKAAGLDVLQPRKTLIATLLHGCSGYAPDITDNGKEDICSSSLYCEVRQVFTASATERLKDLIKVHDILAPLTPYGSGQFRSEVDQLDAKIQLRKKRINERVNRWPVGKSEF